jgi:hypothetical protein
MQFRYVDFVTVQRDSDSWSFPINKWIKTKTGENGRAIISINRCNTGEELEGLEAASDAEFGADAPAVAVPSVAAVSDEEEDDWMAPSATAADASSATGPASFADDADAMPPIEDDQSDLPGALPLPVAEDVNLEVAATKTVPCTEGVAPVTTTPCPESTPTKTPCPEDTPMPTPCTETPMPTPCPEHPSATETAEAPVVEVTTTPCATPTPTPVGYGPVVPPLVPETEEFPEVPESAVGPPPFVMPPPSAPYGYGPVETPFPETEEYPEVPLPPVVPTPKGYGYGPVETPYPEILPPPIEEEYEYGPVETPTPVIPHGYGYGPVETPYPEEIEEVEEEETPYAPPKDYGYGPVETPFPPTPTGYGGYGPIGTPFPETGEEYGAPEETPLPYGYGPVETPFPSDDLLIPTPTPSVPRPKKKCVHKKKKTHGYAAGVLPPVKEPKGLGLGDLDSDDFMGQLPKGLTDDVPEEDAPMGDMTDMDDMEGMTLSPQEKKASKTVNKEYELPYAKSH